MRQVGSLNHSRWECKYDVVFIPKYRKQAIFGQIRRDLGEVLGRLAQQRESEIEEGHLMPDHVHMMISIPPKYAVAQVVGYSGVFPVWVFRVNSMTSSQFSFRMRKDMA